MLRHRCLVCFAGLMPTPLWCSAWAALRAMSTRQAERLRRSSTIPMTGGIATSRVPRTGRVRCSRDAGGSAHRPKKAPSEEDGASPTVTPARSAASAGRAKPLPGRFNRLTVQLGFLVTFYHYVLAEIIHLFLTYLLHWHRLGIGDTGSWLAAVGVPEDRFLNVGPTMYGLQLSPRLLLNYLAVNVCVYPSIPLQLRFCVATAPILRAPFRLMGRWLGISKRAIVPKAPRSAPS